MIPTCLQKVQHEPSSGLVCKQNKQTIEKILLMEEGHQLIGQCLPHSLEQVPGVDEPTLGNHPPKPHEGEKRQSQSAFLSPTVENSEMVGNVTRHDGGNTIAGKECTTLPRTTRTKIPTTTLGNPFWGAAGLKAQDARQKLRHLENQQDIPTKTRIKWVQDTLGITTNPKVRTMMSQTIKRLNIGSKKPKYPVFYDLKPLLDRAFQEEQPNLHIMPMNNLLDKLLLQLRLTTMMRSGDASNIVWALFEQDKKYYIKTTDKNGVIQVFNVTGQTFTTLLEYLTRHLMIPGLYLFRYVNKPWEYLGSERLAKRLLAIMTEENIDTQVFKAHSLRGATATHLLQQGTSQTLVQARGKWASSKTLDDYYSRLHQTENWEKLLGGNGKERQASACAVLPLTVSQPTLTEEGERRKTQGDCTAQVDALHAQGVLRPSFVP